MFLTKLSFHGALGSFSSINRQVRAIVFQIELNGERSSCGGVGGGMPNISARSLGAKSSKPLWR